MTIVNSVPIFFVGGLIGKGWGNALATVATRRRGRWERSKQKSGKAISPTGSRTPSGSPFLSTSDDVPRQLGVVHPSLIFRQAGRLFSYLFSLPFLSTLPRHTQGCPRSTKDLDDCQMNRKMNRSVRSSAAGQYFQLLRCSRVRGSAMTRVSAFKARGERVFGKGSSSLSPSGSECFIARVYSVFQRNCSREE